jgi:hypothetical protein
MPIGIHHLFADPEVGAGFKVVHSIFTAMVAVPTLLTVFTICASVEIAARLRGGKGVFGWVKALPWANPQMLALALSFVMLGFGGAGGLINMSYQLDSTIHNTQWVTGHFHLIFGGAIVIMYFALAYDLWPHLTGRALLNLRFVHWQLWLWFIGMIVLTFPWHYAGLLGMPRRMAFYDYTAPGMFAEGVSVVMSTIGGAMLVISAALFIIVLVRNHYAARVNPEPFTFSRAVHEPVSLPWALNGLGLWLGLMIALTITNYGYPIVQLMMTPERTSSAQSLVRRQRRRNLSAAGLLGVRRLRVAAVGSGRLPVQGIAEFDLQRCGRTPILAGRSQSACGFIGQGIGRGHDAEYARRVEIGRCCRPGRDVGATLHHVSRASRREFIADAEPGRAIRVVDLQGTA